ncbi:MAG: DUF3352 domain-containing protein [Chloroflexota bacterium]
MKKNLRFILLIIAMVSMVGTTPMNRTKATPLSLAAMMPADMSAYAELRTSDMPSTLVIISSLLKKTNLPFPPNLFSDVDRSMSQAFGRTASVEQDVLPWVGESAAIGLYVPEKLIDYGLTGRQYPASDPQPDVLILATVKDETAADAFVQGLITAGSQPDHKLTASLDKIGTDTVIVYSDDKDDAVMARWKGYLAFGSHAVSRLLDTLKNHKPTLADNPSYQKVTGMLKPNNLVTVYYRSLLISGAALALTGPAIGNIFDNIVAGLQTPLGVPTATPTPTPTPTPAPETLALADAFKNLGATAIGGYGDTKMLSLDVASYVDPANLTKVFALLKIPADVQVETPAPPISIKLADRIPDTALAVIIGSNLAQLIQNGRAAANAVVKFNNLISRQPNSSTPDMNSIEATYGQIEGTLKLGFDLDLSKDVLGWLDGEFALYMTYNPNSDLSSGGSWPFDNSLLIDTANGTDAANAENFLTKLNKGLPGMGVTLPVRVTRRLYIYNPTKDGTGPTIGYGLVKNGFVVSTGSGLKLTANSAKAMQGDVTMDGTIGALAADANWQDTIALLPKAYQHVWYVNLQQLGETLKAAGSQGNPSTQQVEDLVAVFKSALMYSTDFGGGSSMTTFALLFK